MPPMNHKTANKQPKNKKKQPLKVVYISNPMKFKTSASEFRALVQELTGQDAHTPQHDGVGGGGVEAVEVAAVDNFHAVLGEGKIGHPRINGEVEQEGSDPSTTGSYGDVVDDFFCPEMMGISRGLWDQI